MKEAFDFKPGTSSALKSVVARASAVKVSGASPPDRRPQSCWLADRAPVSNVTEARPEASVGAMDTERFPPPCRDG